MRQFFPAKPEKATGGFWGRFPKKKYFQSLPVPFSSLDIIISGSATSNWWSTYLRAKLHPGQRAGMSDRKDPLWSGGVTLLQPESWSLLEPALFPLAWRLAHSRQRSHHQRGSLSNKCADPPSPPRIIKKWIKINDRNTNLSFQLAQIEGEKNSHKLCFCLFYPDVKKWQKKQIC